MRLNCVGAVGAGVLLALAACEPPLGTTVSGSCVAATNIGGVLFGFESRPYQLETPLARGEVVATITKNRGCEDTPVDMTPVAPLAPGESNHLEEGTTICAIPGSAPTKRLILCVSDPRDPYVLVSHPTAIVPEG